MIVRTHDLHRLQQCHQKGTLSPAVLTLTNTAAIQNNLHHLAGVITSLSCRTVLRAAQIPEADPRADHRVIPLHDSSVRTLAGAFQP